MRSLKMNTPRTRNIFLKVEATLEVVIIQSVIHNAEQAGLGGLNIA